MKDLVLPAAFTGKFTITEQLWNKLKDIWRNDSMEVSPQILLIKSLEDYFELLSPEFAFSTNYKVACVKIEFNNYEVLNLLQQKATALDWGKTELASELEK